MKNKYQSACSSTLSLAIHNRTTLTANVTIDIVDLPRRRKFDTRQGNEDSIIQRRATHSQQTRREEPLCDPMAQDLLEEEIRNLPDDNLLVRTDQYSVFVAKAERIPFVLQEIGRLRETT